MSLRAPFALVLGLAILPLAAGQVLAQSDASGQTAEQIEQLFQKHRGLVLAPSATENATTPSAEGTTVTTSPAYVEIPKGDQVYVAISFDFDSAALRPDQEPRLATLCQAMHNVDIPLFRIIGHTDAVGSSEYNDRLSQLRAEEVKRHLVSDCGIAEERLEAVGVGQRHLLTPDDPGGAENRRVEFQAAS